MHTHEFFLICPIGLEKLLLKELEFKFPQITDIAFEPGGVTINCSLELGLCLNKYLKTTTRILLRLKKQKCRDLPKLYQILRKVDWKHYLKQKNLTFSVSCKKSRLMHTDKIKTSAQEAVSDYFNANAIAGAIELVDAPPQGIFLRFNEDLLTISLDTSGESLHKRGNLEFLGHAKIRENIASLLLIRLLGLEDHSTFQLIDPMCGSGTFLKEASNFHRPNERSFSYLNWKNITDKSYSFTNPWNFKGHIGVDLNEKLNPKNKQTYDFINDNFFNFEFKNPCIVILNPPYGKRIKLPTSPQAYFDTVIRRLKDQKNIYKFGIIIPAQYAKDYSQKTSLSFNQNGIKVKYLTFARK